MHKMKWDFKETNTYEVRRNEGEKLHRQYPDRCAVIVQRAPNSKLPDLAHKKFLVPTDLSVRFNFNNISLKYFCLGWTISLSCS